MPRKGDFATSVCYKPTQQTWSTFSPELLSPEQTGWTRLPKGTWPVPVWNSPGVARWEERDSPQRVNSNQQGEGNEELLSHTHTQKSQFAFAGGFPLRMCLHGLEQQSLAQNPKSSRNTKPASLRALPHVPSTCTRAGDTLQAPAGGQQLQHGAQHQEHQWDWGAATPDPRKPHRGGPQNHNHLLHGELQPFPPLSDSRDRQASHPTVGRSSGHSALSQILLTLPPSLTQPSSAPR